MNYGKDGRRMSQQRGKDLLGVKTNNGASKTQKYPRSERAAIEKLALNASRGNQEALLELCDSIEKKVFVRAMRILNNRMDAEDVAQETLVRVCRQITHLKDARAFYAWLGSIIVNESKRHMMKNSKYKEVLQINEIAKDALEQDEAVLPFEHIDRIENRKMVNEAILLLPARQREAIILHYFDELSVKETASAMDIPIQSASNYLKLARAKIKITLERLLASAKNTP